ncbi:PrgI family protein [Candidatus Microgenomates bacterium]|nr:PrgI family protein [Candidatus Microgenomates bacterium]
MDQHPIPQNITNFEFKLIGDMTIKQFAYLAGCVTLAYIFFLFPLHPFIKFPTIVFLVLLGVALAFVPVEGRPLDRWISNFIRALFSPSQYIFHKDAAAGFFPTHASLAEMPLSERAKIPTVKDSDERFTTFLKQTQTPFTDMENSPESLSRIQKLAEEAAFQPTPHQSGPTPVTQTIPSPTPPSPPVSQPSPASPTPLTSSTPIKSGPTDELEKKFREMRAEKEQLLKELEELKRSVATPTPLTSPTVSTAPRPAPLFATPPKPPRSTGTLSPFPQAPNIVAGVVKDCKDELLPNIIVEVKDTGGTPLRAFKTNKLGQFFASTPLPNGQYAIELEDPRNIHFFDPAGVNLTGSPLVPLEIKARDPAVNERLKLHAALFGNKITNS